MKRPMARKAMVAKAIRDKGGNQDSTPRSICLGQRRVGAGRVSTKALPEYHRASARAVASAHLTWRSEAILCGPGRHAGEDAVAGVATALHEQAYFRL